MDYQTTYNEAMVKLAEAQKCQDEITDCSKELQQVNNVINGTTNPQLYYQLKDQHVKLLCKIDEQIKERNKKLNEALSKTLDLVDKDLENRVYHDDSIGLKTWATILCYMATNNIKMKYSVEVILKQEQIVNRAAREIKYQSFINQLKMLSF